MACEKKSEKPELAASRSKLDTSHKLDEQDKAPGKDGKPSVLTASISCGEVTYSVKGETNMESVAEQVGCCPPTSCYDYYYPGYNGAFTQLDEHGYFNNGGGGSFTGFQSDNGSMLYYLPGYNPYSSGSFLRVDGQQPYYSSSGFLQHPVSYGSEALPYYPWDSTYTGDIANGTTPGKSKSSTGSNASAKSNAFNSVKSSSTLASKIPSLPLDSKSRQSLASSNFSKSMLQSQSQPLKAWSKIGSGYQSAGLVKGFQPVGKFSSFINQNQGLFMHNGSMNYRTNGRILNGNNSFKLRDRNAEFDASTELTRGPRVQSMNNPSSTPAVEEQKHTIQRDKYNLQDFQTEYANAKFYTIKSYSEDDVHKCIKYEVWSSTPNGNKKLDAAFRDVEFKASETGTKCPIFLFFSVNGSGQFVGVAEMVGNVDFNKDMDFWQLDKWSGCFSVKWHIIKDVPNTQLRHIILENNENKPVTYSRDTQEVGLKQGIDMLTIFKSYAMKTSLLDDVDFYENREKLLKGKRISKKASSQAESYQQSGERSIQESVRANDLPDPASSLIDLTKNLSLNSQPPKGGTIFNQSENSAPPVSVPKF